MAPRIGRRPNRLKPRLYYVGASRYQRRQIERRRDHPRWTWTGVRIFGYHRVSDDGDVLAVRPDAFRRQMEDLLAWDVKPIALRDAVERLAGEERIDERWFAVTFDDGYLDVLENAVPILRDLEIPATIFVPSAVIDGDATYAWYRNPPPALTWAQIVDLVADGLVDVQAHGRTHRTLPRLPDHELRTEIAGSKRDVEEHVPYEVQIFCYPAGLYRERECEVVRLSGYRAAVTTDPGVNNVDADLFRLRRTMIGWADADDEFEAKAAGIVDKRPRAAAWLHARRSRPQSAGLVLRSAQRLFEVNRRAARRIEGLLPQAGFDIEAAYDEVVVETMNAIEPCVVADIGSGRSSSFARRRSAAGTRIIAVDSSPEELAFNTDVDEHRVADVTQGLPFEPGELDLIVSRSVLEHLDDVEAFVARSEAALKPGGYSIHLLASKFAPYALINQALPDTFSARVVTYLRPGTEGRLGFPAVYDRCYDSELRRVFERNGFEVVETRKGYYQSEYFSFLLPLYVASAVYELAISAVDAADLAARLLIVARKR